MVPADVRLPDSSVGSLSKEAERKARDSKLQSISNTLWATSVLKLIGVFMSFINIVLACFKTHDSLIDQFGSSSMMSSSSEASRKGPRSPWNVCDSENNRCAN